MTTNITKELGEYLVTSHYFSIMGCTLHMWLNNWWQLWNIINMNYR